MVFHLSEIEKKIGYFFKNPEILRVAFTHASFSNEKRGEKNNERLEYLGDSVLGFIVATFIYKEKLNKIQLLGYTIGVASVILLNI